MDEQRRQERLDALKKRLVFAEELKRHPWLEDYMDLKDHLEYCLDNFDFDDGYWGIEEGIETAVLKLNKLKNSFLKALAEKGE